MVYKKIINILQEAREPLTQIELSKKLPGSMNRAVLLGYLRALADTKQIKAKNSGKAKIYYL